jgi:hypothetical protein
MLLVVLLGGIWPVGSLAQADSRVAHVTTAAIEQSRQLELGDFPAVYDRLHPDLRNRLPRQAFAAWAASTCRFRSST